LEELLLRDAEEGVSDKGIQAIILEPTRELAIQVKAQIDKFSSLSSVLVYGGDSVKASHNSKNSHSSR
jgi:superfamily II DNA/RNA helicase